MLFGALFLSPHAAHAALYNASGVMGQNSYSTNGIGGGSNSHGFNKARDTIVDPVNHRLFVADTLNNRVLVFNLDSTDGVVSTTASYVFGQPDFTSNAAGTSQDKFNQPYGLTYDAATERLFVADTYNSRVMIFDASTSTLDATTTYGEDAEYVFGQSDFVSGGANAINQSATNYPDGLAYDLTSDRLFVSDPNDNRVLAFDASTSTLDATTTYGENAEYVFGQPDFVSSGNATAQNGLHFPNGLVYDSATGRLFVADNQNNRVLAFDASTSTLDATTTYGEDAEYVFGQPDFISNGSGGGQNHFDNPTGLTYDPAAGRLFAADNQNSRILVFDASTSTLDATTTYGENAEYVFGSGWAPTLTPGMLNYPNGLSYDSATKSLFVADTLDSRVLGFDASTSTLNGAPSGEDASYVLGQTDIDGNPSFSKGNIDGGPYANGFNNPFATAIDSVGNRLFVADTYNNRVMVFDLDPTTGIASTTASYVFGQSDPTSFAPIYPVTQNGLNQPFGLTYDPATGRLFVADTYNNRVLVFDASTSTLNSTSSGENAEYVFGQSDFVSNNSGADSSELNNPIGLTYDPATGRLFVADTYNNRVLVFDASTSTLDATTTYGENAEYVFGQSDFTSSGNATAQNGLHYPNGLTYDPATGRLFVADTYNNRVLVFDASTSTLDATTTYGENAEYVFGQSDFTSSGNAETQNGFGGFPNGLTYDSTTGRLFVADSNGSRILVFDASTSTLDATTTYGEDAENVLAQADFTTGTPQATQSGLYSPNGIIYDPATQTFFVADTNNNRVMEYSFIKIVDPELPDGTVGAPYNAILNTTSSQGTVSFSLYSGILPDGLSFATSTGVISGTPTTAGDNNFAIMDEDGFSTGNFYTLTYYMLAIDLASTPSSPAPSVIVGVGGGGGGGGGGAYVPPATTPAPSSTPYTSSSGSSNASLLATLQSLYQQLRQLEASAGLPLTPIPTGIPATTPTPSFTRDLTLGSTGADVTALQKFLIAQSTGPAAQALKAHGTTSYFGALTKAALQEFQKAHGITPVSGYFGPKTRAWIAAGH
jgi:DNA-binding beta-propeller fold protein YncE